MGRKFFIVSAICALSVFACEIGAAQGPRRSPRFHPQGPGRPNSGQLRAGHDRFFQLSPEERQVFRRNAERWLQMNPEQQRILREREQVRHQQLKVEAEAAMHQAGLRLEGPARAQFEARYLQERRRIERALRQETEAKRQQELPQLNERLKSEFQVHQGASPGASSSASPGRP